MDSYVDVSSWKKGRAGRKKKELDIEKIKNGPLHRRGNLRSLAKAVDVPESTFFDRFSEGIIRRHSNAVKPQLDSKKHEIKGRILPFNIKI